MPPLRFRDPAGEEAEVQASKAPGAAEVVADAWGAEVVVAVVVVAGAAAEVVERPRCG